MQHLAINIHMKTHGTICICLSANHPRAGNMCLPKLREWAGVKAMTTLSDVNLHQEKTYFSLFKKQHTKCNLIDTFLQKNVWAAEEELGLKLKHAAECPSSQDSALAHCTWCTRLVQHRYTDGAWGPPMSHGMHRLIVSSQLLTITHKSVKIHEHFLNTIVGTEVQLPCHFAPWQTVLIFKAWEKKNIFMTSLQFFLAVTLMFVERAKNHIPYVLLMLSVLVFRNHP